MKLDRLDASGTVVRFPVERRQTPHICLANELSAVNEMWGGVLDYGDDEGWPDWADEGAADLAALVEDLAAEGTASAQVLAAAAGHVDALVGDAVALGWAYQDAKHRAGEARAALAASNAADPAADWLGRLRAEADRTAQALHDAALASCKANLRASGASDALENLRAGCGARLFTKEELEASLLMQLQHAS